MTRRIHIILTLLALLSLCGRAQVAPLVKTAWHQQSPYNDLCPKGMLAGCVAVAMAQVMNYHQYPPHGIGSSRYTWQNPSTGTSKTLSANYANTWYRWDDMDGDDISAAQLIYHCGVSVWMDYSDYFSGSNEYYAKSALTDYFGYSDDIRLEPRNKYTDEEWAALLKANLDQGWPVIYSSGGHTFVVDGYNATGKFHANQGFGYVSPDYTYTLDGLGSKSTSTALVNIHPDPTKKSVPTTPTLVVYLNSKGTSKTFTYSEADNFSLTADSLLVQTGEKTTRMALKTVSYFKAFAP